MALHRIGSRQRQRIIIMGIGCECVSDVNRLHNWGN